MLGRIVNNYKSNKFLGVGLERTVHFHCDAKKYSAGNTVCEIVCIAYNNHELAPLQHALLKKNLKGEYHYIIADNSSDTASREKIAAYCKKEGIAYISLPENPNENGSRSHAAAMNWILKNYLLQKAPAYFGFIDHDIFPIESFSAEEHLKKQPVYGLLQERGELWYLWAGFCFFNFSKVQPEKMDLMPGPVNGTNLDTGGQNWEHLYSKLKKNELEFPSQTYQNLREGDVAQSDKVEIIGKWLHSFNGSYWMKVDKKEHLLEAYLKQYMS